MTRLVPILLAFTGGLLLGRFAPPPILGWLGVLWTPATRWSVAVGCGVALAVALLLAPAGRPRRWIGSVAMGGILFVPLLFGALVGTAALGEQLTMAPSTLNTLSVVSPIPAYLAAIGYVVWRAGRKTDA